MSKKLEKIAIRRSKLVLKAERQRSIIDYSFQGYDYRVQLIGYARKLFPDLFKKPLVKGLAIASFAIMMVRTSKDLSPVPNKRIE
ncbi:MAG: hypothetical protein R6V47_05705 [Candidatus Delongbacteria bacterium]